jgi:DNA-directed RNA polymerase subunit H (RpoH/RPB5)
MLTNPYRFHTISGILKPARILYDSEKITVLDMFAKESAHIHSISVNDLISVELNAQIGDIICIRNGNTEIYRRVISQNK